MLKIANRLSVSQCQYLRLQVVALASGCAGELFLCVNAWAKRKGNRIIVEILVRSDNVLALYQQGTEGKFCS